MVRRLGDLELRNADRRSRVIVEFIQLGAEELYTHYILQNFDQLGAEELYIHYVLQIFDQLGAEELHTHYILQIFDQLGAVSITVVWCRCRSFFVVG